MAAVSKSVKTFTASPRRVAAAIGVSESSIKRWCDQGQLVAERTPGGHRRISVEAVLRLVRDSGSSLQTPAALYGDSSAPRSIASARRALTSALVSDDFDGALESIARQWQSSSGFDVLADELIAPALATLGERWSRGRLEIYQERRACELVLRCLQELGRRLVAPGSAAPRALGGTLEGDPFAMPTALAEIVLRERGWDARSLGTWLPAATLARAIVDQAPDLVWLSIGHCANERQIVRDVSVVERAARSVSAAVVVGGRALAADVRRRLRHAAFCDGMVNLTSFAAVVTRRRAASGTS